MKIQLLSDLHIEFYTKFDYTQFQTDADVLVLAGDINAGRTNTRKSLKIFSGMYERVVYVHGNHEMYGGHINNYNDFKAPNNVHFLNRNSVIIQDVEFIGCPLWTDFMRDDEAATAAKHWISDFRRIEGATVDAYVSRQEEDVKFIFETCNNSSTERRVVVTHWIPAIELVDPKYWKQGDKITMLLNKYFANNLGNKIAKLKNTTWLFGHTHSSCDSVIGHTKCVANPAGYWTVRGFENENFNPKFILEV